MPDITLRDALLRIDSTIPVFVVGFEDNFNTTTRKIDDSFLESGNEWLNERVEKIRIGYAGVRIELFP